MKTQYLIFGVAIIATAVVAYKWGAKKEHDKVALIINPATNAFFELDSKLQSAVNKGWTAKQFQDSLKK